MKRSICIILLLFLFKFGFSQRIVDGIDVTRGRGLTFLFNSITEVENGKSLGSLPIGYTEIYVYFDTTDGFVNPEVKGWELVAYTTSPSLSADFGAPDLTLTKIILNAQLTIGVGTVVNSSYLSSDPNNVIASGDIGNGINGGVEWRIAIAYDCGKEVGFEGLVGVEADYYYTELIFEIRPVYV